MSDQSRLVWRAKWMGRLSLAQATAATIAAAALAIEGGHPTSTAFWAAIAMLSLASAEVWRWSRVKHERQE